MTKRQLVAMVTTEIFTPYKAGEVFYVTPDLADKLLRVDSTRTSYGVQKYPKVKCRKFDASNPQDLELLLSNKSLNLSEHNALLKKLHPDAVIERGEEAEFESDVSNLLKELMPEPKKETSETPATTRKSKTR